MRVIVADDDVPLRAGLARATRAEFPHIAILLLPVRIEVEHGLELLASGQLWVTESTVEKHVHSILTKPTPPEADGHRRVLAVVTLLQAR
jgi:hypothetical protein